jgi:glycosyltransferase involved in cell wall biosynthesis
MKNVFVVSNDQFFLKNNNIYNSNKNTFTIINSFKKFEKIFLIARKSKKKFNFKDKINNIQLMNFWKIFTNLKKIYKSKILIISLTPFNFLISLIFILVGIRKKNIFLFLRSDGFEEYKVKFGHIGFFIYGFMFFILKKNLTILTCSKTLTSVINPKLVYPSEIDHNWLKNRHKKKNLKKNKKINLLYVGRFREEKGYSSLINIYEKLGINSSLTMIGNDYKYLKRKNYPKNKNIKIISQVSNLKKLISYYDKSDILILPSYVEAYPQVVLESLSRLRPIIIFNEIKYLKKTFSFGLFNCDRSSKSLIKNILKIKKNYNKIQLKISKNKIFTLENFHKDMNKIFK